MKRYTLYTLIATTLIAASCTSDDSTPDYGSGGTSSSGAVTFNIPLTVEVSNATPTDYYDNDGTVTRAATRVTSPGDPGTTEEFPYPANLYFFSFMSNNDGTVATDDGTVATDETYQFIYMVKEDLDASNWTMEYPDSTESSTADYNTENARWAYNGGISLNFGMQVSPDYSSLTATDDETGVEIGHNYVIAMPSGKKINNSASGTSNIFASKWFDATNYPTINPALLRETTVGYVVANKVPKSEYEAFVEYITSSALIDISSTGGWFTDESTTDEDGNTTTTNTAAWSSDDLRDTYSSPVLDPNDNGSIVYSSTDKEIMFNDIRLYHAAAKYDYQWEVAESLRNTTSGKFLADITVTNCPNEWLIFNPVNYAPETTTTTSNTQNVITTFDTTDGLNNDKVDEIYLGREYVYCIPTPLSNSTATVSYTTTIGTVETTSTDETTTSASDAIDGTTTSTSSTTASGVTTVTTTTTVIDGDDTTTTKTARTYSASDAATSRTFTLTNHAYYAPWVRIRATINGTTSDTSE